ncbi:MAG: prenyltransferase [Candidatus Sericytochromatia bacterium]|nr:prenyltransferase [Candidatus Sericytochromatia bacterium]
MRAAAAWLRAARLPSLGYLWLPLLLGQGLAWRLHGAWSDVLAGWVLAYGACTQLWIVFANDLADEAADRLNPSPTFLSGGGRMLVDGRLTRVALRRAALAAAVGALACAGVVAAAPGRLGVWPLAAGGLVLLWAYSFPPLRLSYRGGGEWLQAVGLGGVLPVLGYWSQAGTLVGWPVLLLPPLLLVNLAIAMATALPDEPGDRLAGKRTVVVVHGPLRASGRILGALLAGLAGWAAVRAGVPGFSWPVAWHLGPAVLAWGAAAVVLARAPRAAAARRLPFVLLVIASGLAWVAMLTADVWLSPGPR